jgi:pimeloyl-ACP methyl ester carboxylesterase
MSTTEIRDEAATAVRYRTEQVDGHALFFREAGEPGKPAVVLLHGAPSSSYMFRDLVPLLADRYHVVAPDLLGFGLSDAPPADAFDYTFDALTDLTEGLLGKLGIDRFAVYVQDYGAPVAWRLALRSPERIAAIVTQNGNAYEDGFVDSFWQPLWDYAANPTPELAAPLRGALELDAIEWQYTHGVPEPERVNPESWHHDHERVQRPGNPEIQLALFRDYPTNRTLYPQVHEYFRRTQVPVLAAWGGNDEIFGPDGARAYARDLPEAEIHLLDTGHFALETHTPQIAALMRDFLGRHAWEASATA